VSRIYSVSKQWRIHSCHCRNRSLCVARVESAYGMNNPVSKTQLTSWNFRLPRWRQRRLLTCRMWRLTTLRIIDKRCTLHK
jgi:hypothetical protein